jgi:hypothetical protein
LELAALLGCCVFCGGFFLRTEVRADVSLVACMLQVRRLSRRRRVPVRSTVITGDGEEAAAAVIEDARVAVAAVVVLASAAQGLADIRRHGSALTPSTSSSSYHSQSVREGRWKWGRDATANVPKQEPKQGDGWMGSGALGSGIASF